MIENGEKSAKAVIDAVKAEIEKEPLAKIDYVEIVDWNNLKSVEEIKAPILMAIAVYIGKTRLIDNFIIEE
jgi:pantoate--beta-alanine ligase